MGAWNGNETEFQKYKLFFSYWGFWAESSTYDNFLQLNANQESITGRLQSQSRPWEKIKKKRLQATSLGDFWTARGTSHAFLPSQLIWKDNLSLCRHPRAGTSNSFETLLLRKRAKILHKVKTQFAAQDQCWTLSKCIRNPPSLKREGYAFAPCESEPVVCFSLGETQNMLPF